MDWIKYIAAMTAMMCIIWGIAYLFSSTIKDYEIIEPEDGVHCVVVSRMFNTSVDCYKLNVRPESEVKNVHD